MDKWLITYQDLKSKKKSVIEAQTKNEAIDKGRNAFGDKYLSCEKIEYLNGDKNPIKHTEFNNGGKPKILILGTRITAKSIEAGYFYLGTDVESNNPFWKIMSKVFAEPLFIEGKNTKERIANIKEAQKRHNIVVSDLIYSCYYTGSGDGETITGLSEKGLDDPKFNQKDLLKLMYEADLVVLNGGYSSKGAGTLNYFHLFLKNNGINYEITLNKNKVLETGTIGVKGKKTPFVSLGSTSGENRKSTIIKQEEWKRKIEELLK